MARGRKAKGTWYIIKCADRGTHPAKGPYKDKTSCDEAVSKWRSRHNQVADTRLADGTVKILGPFDKQLEAVQAKKSEISPPVLVETVEPRAPESSGNTES